MLAFVQCLWLVAPSFDFKVFLAKYRTCTFWAWKFVDIALCNIIMQHLFWVHRVTVLIDRRSATCWIKTRGCCCWTLSPMVKNNLPTPLKQSANITPPPPASLHLCLRRLPDDPRNSEKALLPVYQHFNSIQFKCTQAVHQKQQKGKLFYQCWLSVPWHQQQKILVALSKKYCKKGR